MTESALKASIVRALRYQGCLVYPTYGHPVGAPDYIVFAPGGRVVAMEVKTAVGRLTKAQEKQLELLNKLGTKAVVVRSVQEALSVMGGLAQL